MASSSLGASTSGTAILRHGPQGGDIFPFPKPSNLSINLPPQYRPPSRLVSTLAKKRTEGVSVQQANPKTSKAQVVQEEEEVEEDLPWIQEKALDLVEFTGSVTQALPGPRVGQTSLPWILAVPLAYAGVTFVIAFVKTLRKFNSPKAKRRKLVNKNAMLCISLDELFQKGKDEVHHSTLKDLMQKAKPQRSKRTREIKTVAARKTSKPLKKCKRKDGEGRRVWFSKP